MVATKTKGILAGTSPTWEVSAEGFETQSGVVENISADTVLPTVYLIGEISGADKININPNTSWYIDINGDLYGCGNNGYGQQGSGTSGSGTNVTTFTKRAENVKKVVSCNNVTWYIDNNDDLYGCGYNYYGQQGSGDTTNVTTFTKRASNVKDVIIDRRGDLTWYITNDGDLYSCGSKSNYRQGTGDSSGSVTTFTKRTSNVKTIKSGDTSTWYITTNGDLYGCGFNYYGNQGSGTSGSGADVTTFTKRASNVKDVVLTKTTDNYVTWYIDNNDDLYGCGNNGYGQQGSGNTSNVTTFTKRASNVKDVKCDNYITWYLTNNGDLYGCGYNLYGNQGAGSATQITTFTKRASNVKEFNTNFSNQAYTTWYITNDGELYGCGCNDNGQQGSGNTSNVTTFTKRAENVKDVVCTAYTLWYITNDGELYGCGDNYNGQQGSGDTTDVTTFTKRAENVKDVKCDNYITWYINNSNSLYGCGNNGYGQQGSGTSGSGTNVTTFTKRVNGSVNTANITISPTPADATVTINSESISSADVRKGLPVEWSVSKTGYVTQTGTIDHIYDDTTLEITLESE